MKRMCLVLVLVLCMVCRGAKAQSLTGYLWDIPVGIPMVDAIEAMQSASGRSFSRSFNSYSNSYMYKSVSDVIIEDLPFEFIASSDDNGSFYNLTGNSSNSFSVSLRELPDHSPSLFSSIERILTMLAYELGDPIYSCWNFGTKYPNSHFDIPSSDGFIDYAKVLEISRNYPGSLQFVWDHVFLSISFSQISSNKTYVSLYLNSSDVQKPAFVSSGAFSEHVLLGRSIPSLSSSENNYTSIRGGLTFASSYDDVKAYEGKPDSISSGIVSYFDISVVHRKADAHYTFDSKENLDSLAIFFTKPHSEYGKYLEDYDAVSQALTEKYGKPLISDTEWANSLFQDSKDMHGTALAMGYMKKYAMWLFKDGTIYHSISGDNFEVEHSILYSSNLSVPSSKPIDLGI